MGAVYSREMQAYFVTPIGYVYLAAFWLLAGYEFSVIILNGQADLTAEYSFLYTMAVLLIPILTMRLMSEERRQRTDKVLMSAPVSLFRIVLGKYLAALTVYLAGISVTLLYAVVLAAHSAQEWALVFGNFAGLVAVGMAGIALCMFISSLTESQMAAAIGGLAAMVLLLALDSIAAAVPPGFLRTALYAVSFVSRYYELTVGMLNLTDLCYFISFAVIFVFLTVRMQEKRRWSGV